MPTKKRHPASTPLMADGFLNWINAYDSQFKFGSVQEAYKVWLIEYGFAVIGDDYSYAALTLIHFLGQYIVDPTVRTVLINKPEDPEETRILRVLPFDEEDPGDDTPWDFMIEENFNLAYQRWFSETSKR